MPAPCFFECKKQCVTWGDGQFSIEFTHGVAIEEIVGKTGCRGVWRGLVFVGSYKKNGYSGLEKGLERCRGAGKRVKIGLKVGDFYANGCFGKKCPRGYA